MADDPALPRLLLLSDTTCAPAARVVERFAAFAAAARPGSVVLVLRDYGLSGAERFTLGQALGLACRASEQILAVAERADLARALEATWFHLPESGLSAADARAYLGTHVRLSRAAHDPTAPAEPELAARVLSPIVAARKGRPAWGLGVLAASPLPVFALGGVGPEHAAACISAGAAGVAVIGAGLALDPLPLLDALGIRRD